MRYFWLLAFGLLLLVALGAIPASGGNIGTKLFLPEVRKDFTATPTPTFTPTATPTSTPTPVPAVHFQYRAYVQNQAWLPWQGENGYAGTAGIGQAMQAFQMKMTGGPSATQLRYRAYVSNRGWLDWQTAPPSGAEGGVAGDTGGNQVEAIEIGLDNPPAGTYVGTQPYVADLGYLGYVR